MKSGLLALLAVVVVAMLVACGIPGAPQPPSLELPRTVQNLYAVRKGDQVRLTWSTPRETTDRARIKHLGATRICRAVNQVAVAECVETVGTLPPERTPLGAAASFTDTLPIPLQQQHPMGFAYYSVEVQNTRGRGAGLSNQVSVPLAFVPRAAVDLEATVTAEGVRLAWRGDRRQQPALTYSYEVFRQPEEAPAGAPRVDLGAGELGNPQVAISLNDYFFVDRTMEWEKPYRYIVEPITRYEVGDKTGSIEGDDRSIEVTPHDVFPPATPTGLQDIFTETPQQSFIDLSWTPDTESDLAGYNVYRHEEGAQVEKINSEMVKVPAYRDTTVQAGHRYFYSVSAVDVRGNESARSQEASEAVPQ
jgi:hypothetical protein